MILLWIIVIGIILLFVLYLVQFKKLRLPNVYFVTGSVKTGKSWCCVWLSIQQHRRNLLKWYFYNYVWYYVWNYFLRFIWLIPPLFIAMIIKRDINFAKLQHTEKPMLYSNIPLANVKYNNLTNDMIMRKVRLAYKSTCLLDEASLIASGFDYKDETLNEQVTLFVKLYGHETKGGYMFYNSQDLKDVHFGFKRSTGRMLYIHHKVKLPFFSIITCRELISVQDDSVGTENNFDADIEKSMLKLFIPNKYFFDYDCYCYSSFTDDLELKVDYSVKKIKRSRFRKANLKADTIVTFRKFKTIGGKVNEKEKH